MGRMIGSAKEKDRLYYFDVGPDLSRQFQSTTVNFVFVSKENDIMLWHYRLGHPNFQYLKYLFPNLFKNKSSSSFQCEVCPFAKHHCASFSPLLRISFLIHLRILYVFPFFFSLLIRL